MRLELGFIGERYIYLPLDIIEQAKSNSMTQSLYIKFLGHFVNAKYHYINRPQGCEDYILLYCREGKGWVKLDDKEYLIKQNIFIILPPNCPHSYGADNSNPWSIYWIHFQGRDSEYLSKLRHTPCKLYPSSTSRIEERLEIFEEIYQVLSIDQSFDYFSYANSCFIHFLSTIIYVNIYREIKQRKESTTHLHSDQLINRLTHYMSENIDRKLSIKDLSHFIHLSPSYLHRLFIRYHGVSPMNFFIKMKMRKACDMLQNTSLKINQIAAKLSYDDSLYFSRQFKKEIGISPNKFRHLDNYPH